MSQSVQSQSAPEPQLWEVYRIFAEQTTPPKPKYIIVTGLPEGAGYVLGLFINSVLNEFQQQPRLEPCFVTVPATTHPFLRYDSVAVCSDVYTFPRAQLRQGEHVGHIQPQTARAIRDGALACPALKRGHKKRFAALTEF